MADPAPSTASDSCPPTLVNTVEYSNGYTPTVEAPTVGDADVPPTVADTVTSLPVIALEYARSFHAGTVLPGGRRAVLIDSGSVGNLCGRKWAAGVAFEATLHGKTPGLQPREHPLRV